MANFSKINALFLSGVLLMATLTACGSKSSSTPTTIPSSATIYYAHNLVFRNSTTLLSTGYNGFGQLGTGNLGNRTAPGKLEPNSPFNGAATGGNHSVAFFNNSTVRCWGYNASGQLGNSSITYSSVPVPVFSVISSVTRDTKVNLTGVTAVAAGADHSLALKSDGTVWAWGSNFAGQLGVDALSTPSGYSSVPKKVMFAGGTPLANVVAIAANGLHSLALDSFNKVWVWGYNGSGQLGLDPKGTGSSASPTGIALPLLDINGNSTTGIGFTGIAAGAAFNYAVATNGHLWAWGNNDNGQLGNSTTKESFTPVEVLTAPGVPLAGIVQAAAGIQHGLALDILGRVWAWGYNHYGQLGNGNTADSPVAVLVLTPAGGVVTDIRAFGSSSMAKIGSDWYVWGDNTYGQLGTNSTGTVQLPVKSGF